MVKTKQMYDDAMRFMLQDDPPDFGAEWWQDQCYKLAGYVIDLIDETGWCEDDEM